MRRLRSLAVSSIFAILIVGGATPAEAHVEGGKSQVYGDYLIQFKAVFPSLPVVMEESQLVFSVQDLNGNNVESLKATVRVVREGSLVSEFPPYEGPGDFSLPYSFGADGDYVIMLFIAGESDEVAAAFLVSVYELVPAFLIVNGELVLSASILVIMGLAFVYFRARGRRRGDRTAKNRRDYFD